MSRRIKKYLSLSTATVYASRFSSREETPERFLYIGGRYFDLTAQVHLSLSDAEALRVYLNRLLPDRSKRCTHSIKRTTEIFRKASPTREDPNRLYLALVCTPCRVIKRGRLNATGRFTLISVHPLSIDQVNTYLKSAKMPEESV